MIDSFREKLVYQWRLRTKYSPSPWGEHSQSLWNQRYEVFSKFDQGILSDEIGLYSAVPEKTAEEISKRTKSAEVIDMFCGIGGSTIGFAKAGKKVTALDLDHNRLDMAKTNSRVYGVSGRVKFISGDSLEYIKNCKVDGVGVFIDPPWGGPGFEKKSKFKLSDMSPDGKKILDLTLSRFGEVIFRLPENFDLGELDFLNIKYRLLDNYLHGRLISKTIYIYNA